MSRVHIFTGYSDNDARTMYACGFTVMAKLEPEATVDDMSAATCDKCLNQLVEQAPFIGKYGQPVADAARARIAGIAEEANARRAELKRQLDEERKKHS